MEKKDGVKDTLSARIRMVSSKLDMLSHYLQLAANNKETDLVDIKVVALVISDAIEELGDINTNYSCEES